MKHSFYFIFSTIDQTHALYVLYRSITTDVYSHHTEEIDLTQIIILGYVLLLLS